MVSTPDYTKQELLARATRQTARKGETYQPHGDQLNVLTVPEILWYTVLGLSQEAHVRTCPTHDQGINSRVSMHYLATQKCITERHAVFSFPAVHMLASQRTDHRVNCSW